MDATNGDTAVPPGTIRVTFLHPRRLGTFAAAVSKAITALQCIDNLVKHGFLDPGMSWRNCRLAKRTTGQPLIGGLSLTAMGVREDDVIDVSEMFPD